jgi:hypothetical protein
MRSFLFNNFLSFFTKSIHKGIFQTNRHILILNEHGSHVTVKVIKQAQTFCLNMVILPSHTSHALQPLDVICFKLFKTTFRKKRNNMVKSNC